MKRRLRSFNNEIFCLGGTSDYLPLPELLSSHVLNMGGTKLSRDEAVQALRSYSEDAVWRMLEFYGFKRPQGDHCIGGNEEKVADAG